MKLKENPNVVLNTEKLQSISLLLGNHWETPPSLVPTITAVCRECTLSVEGNKCRGMVGEIQSALVSAGLASRRSPQAPASYGAEMSSRPALIY